MKYKLFISCISLIFEGSVYAYWGDSWSDGSHMIDEVTVTAPDLSGCDDSDTDYRDYDETDWLEDARNGSANNNTSYGGGSSNNQQSDNPFENYSPTLTDHLVRNKYHLPPAGYKQGTASNCVFAGVNFCSMVLKSRGLGEGSIMLDFIHLSLSLDGGLKGIFNVNTISSDLAEVFNYNGFYAVENITDIPAAIDAGLIIMTTLMVGEDSYHNIVIVGYNDSDCYIYYDTESGTYKLIESDDIDRSDRIYTIGIE